MRTRKLIKLLLNNKFIHNVFLPRFLRWLCFFISITCRKKVLGQSYIDKFSCEQVPYIQICWHNNAIFGIHLLRKNNLAILTSSSRDAEIIRYYMKLLNIQIIAGSKNMNATQAILRIRKLLKTGKKCIIAVDGSKGPPLKVKGGVVFIAMITKAPLVTWHFEAKKQWVFPTWDKHKLPKPFTTIVQSYGKPVRLPEDIQKKDIPTYTAFLEKILLDNMHFCQQQVK